jgi:hypothetical protein
MSSSSRSLTSTALGLRKYRIPFDLRSLVNRSAARPVSTTVGVHVGILGAIVFPFFLQLTQDIGLLKLATFWSGDRDLSAFPLFWQNSLTNHHSLYCKFNTVTPWMELLRTTVIMFLGPADTVAFL